MNAHATDIKAAIEAMPDPLALLRRPFPEHQISKLPKETKKQAEQRKAAQDAGNWPAKCKVCGGLHHEKAVHLDYVGHAALTDRLLDTDAGWFWEPLAFRDGLPAFDQTGGLWIKLTVCGVTRLGYGHAASKPGMDPGAREKEVIGDALRNAAMRFGAALDLWHKGDLHAPEDEATEPKPEQPKLAAPAVDWKTLDNEMDACRSVADLEAWNKRREGDIKALPKPRYDALGLKFGDLMAKLEVAPKPAPAEDFGLGADEIPF